MQNPQNVQKLERFTAPLMCSSCGQDGTAVWEEERLPNGAATGQSANGHNAHTGRQSVLTHSERNVYGSWAIRGSRRTGKTDGAEDDEPYGALRPVRRKVR